MNKQRHQDYLTLISAILNCTQGEERSILHSRQELLDAGLLQTLSEVTELLTWNGNEEATQRLQTLATQLSEQLGGVPRSANRRQTQAAADRLFEQGTKHYQVNEFKAALKSWQQALTIYQNIGNSQAEAKVLEHLGIALKSLGDYQQAIEHYQQSLAIQREGSHSALPTGGDRTPRQQTGDIQGEFQQAMQLAISHFEKHLQLMGSIGDRFGEARALANLGKAYASLRNYPQALEYYQKTVVIQRNIGDRAGESATLENLGKISESLDLLSQAIAFYQQRLALLEAEGNLDEIPGVLNDLGNACYNLENYQQAIGYYRQGLSIVRELSERANRGQLSETFSGLGKAYSALGKTQEAIRYYQNSLALKREVGDRFAEAIVLSNLSQAYSALGEYPQAMTYHQQAIEIKQQIGQAASSNRFRSYRFS